MAARKKAFDFEKSLGELEELIDTMEDGELSLESALQHFEKGITLTNECQKALANAEQKVQKLSKKGQQLELEQFTEDDEQY